MRCESVRLRVVMIAAVMAASCGGEVVPTEQAAAPEVTLNLDDFEIVDLSHAFDEETLYWPSSPSRFELDRLHHGTTDGGYFYSAAVIHTPEHGGTHLDAPIHFGEGRWTTDEIPLERLVGPAVVIDISTQSAGDPDYRLTVDDVSAWEVIHGRIPAGSIVLLSTGWSDRWPNAAEYLGDDAPGETNDLHFPAFGEDSARVLVEDRGVAVFGLDTASLDHGPSSDFPVHRIVAAANVPGLENLMGLERLPPTGAWLVALPMKISGGSGGPLRAVAFLP